MATERVYSPDTCEPFDVNPSKASKLVLDYGWSRTPWTRVAVPAPPVEAAAEFEPVEITPVASEDAEEVDTTAVEEPARGRGRRRRAAEAEASEDDDTPTWRS